MAADGLSDALDLVAALLDAEEALLRAALGEPDDDVYLAAHAAVAAFYAAPPGSPPLDPRSGRWATPGGTSPQATLEPGDNVGAVVHGAGRVRVAGEPGWAVFTGDGRDPEGHSLGMVLLVQEVDDALRVTGRSVWDPFEDQITFAAAGGRPVPVDGPFAESVMLRPPRLPEHAAWLADRLGPVDT